MKFRNLKAEEIEVRVDHIGKNYTTLLIYKNARTDMDILDEVVGPENWQRLHYECKGNMYCKVGILFATSPDWVWKSDCGVAGYTEKEKSEASDSFKRACVNWGIGRNLYDAPLILVSNEDIKLEEGADGKTRCKSNFKVTEIGYDENDKINRLTIMRTDWQGVPDLVVFDMGDTKALKDLTAPAPKAAKVERSKEPPKTYERSAKKELCVDCGSLITDAEKAFSEEKYGRALCRKCQKVAK